MSGDEDDMRALLARPIAFNRALVPVAGSITAALMLSQAIYWQGKKDGGWFYKSARDWGEETGMSLDELKTAKRRLIEAKVIDCEVRGMPATTYYRVRFDTILARLRELHQQVGGFPTNKVVGKPPASKGETRQLLEGTETTTENTTERRAANTAHLNGYPAKAKEILAFLNEKTGRRYQPLPANLEMITARLKDGATVEEMRMVVAKKCREWSGDEKMAIYLRPATLFNRTKYAQYQGELGAMS